MAQKIRLGFAVAIALYLVVWSFAIRSLAGWRSDADKLSQANQILTEIPPMLASVENAEAAEREYLSTGKQSYLDNYEAAVRNLDQIIAGLRSMEDTLPSLQVHLDSIDGEIRKTRTEMAQSVKLRRSGDLSGPHEKAILGRETESMDKIRSTIELTRHEWYRSLERSSTDLSEAAWDAHWRLVCCALLSLIMAWLAGSRLISAVQSREAAQAALETSTAELREKTQLLESHNAEILRATQLKSEFLANMSHELRTPLNSITGFSEVLIDGIPGPLNEAQGEYLSEILQGARHLLHLINDVLDLAKVESGKMTFLPALVDLDQSIRETVQMLDLMAQQKQLHIARDIDPDGRYAFLDAARFKQVLFNYLSNALKFTQPKGRITVRVLAEADRFFRLEVQDTGIGISETDQQHLFQEFHQLDAGVAKQFQGAGLGLVLTKRIVEAQGGRVGVESQVGRGSTFFALLPRGKAEIENALRLAPLPKGAGYADLCEYFGSINEEPGVPTQSGQTPSQGSKALRRNRPAEHVSEAE